MSKKFLLSPLFLLSLLLLAVLILFSCTYRESAPEDSRPLSELRVCSENLNRYGERKTSKRKSRKRQVEPEEQLHYLVQRMSEVPCDIIGLQEVYGTSEAEARENVSRIAAALQQETGRAFLSFVGDSEDLSIRNGFLVARDLSPKIQFHSYRKEPLERLVHYGPVGTFHRAPVSVSLQVTDASSTRSVSVFVMNIHFKSKAFGFRDVLHTDFETLRMEMAETSRRLFLREWGAQGEKGIAVLLGDRNNDRGSGTAEVMAGFRTLDDFQGNGRCRLLDSNLPDCQETPRRAPQLIPLLERRVEADGTFERGATYRYKGREEILDEILLPPKLLPLVELSGGRLAVGVSGQFSRGSDHKLSWVRLKVRN